MCIDPAHVDATIQAYTAFVARIIELGLDRDAFAKRVLDVRSLFFADWVGTESKHRDAMRYRWAYRASRSKSS